MRHHNGKELDAQGENLGGKFLHPNSWNFIPFLLSHHFFIIINNLQEMKISPVALSSTICQKAGKSPPIAFLLVICHLRHEEK
jgi:hypothetical protein